MNLQNLCDSVDTTKRLVLINNCFSIRMQQTILAELCCLSKLALPLEGYERISNILVAQNDTLTLFDNGLDISPLSDKMQTRGIILCMTYPTLDADGVAVNDEDKNAILRVYDAQNNSFDIPICKTFVLLGNPISSDSTKILNRMVVENTGNYQLGV